MAFRASVSVLALLFGISLTFGASNPKAGKQTTKSDIVVHGVKAKQSVERTLKTNFFQPLAIDNEETARLSTQRGVGPTNLESALITWIPIDSMANAFGPASRSVKPMAYDQASNSLVIIHRGELSYAQGSGELWLNYSSDAGVTWSRVGDLNAGTGDLLARYPGCAVWNPASDPNPLNAVFVFAAPQLLPGGSGFGRAVYGNNASLNTTNPFAIVNDGNGEWWSNLPIWAGGGTIGSPTAYGVYWTVYTGATQNDINLFRTGDYATIPSGVPPQWATATYQVIGRDLAGWYRNGKSYFSVWASFPGDSAEVFNVGYSTSTNNGDTWTAWTAPGPPSAGKDWRDVPGIYGNIYDDWFNYGGPGVYSYDMVVDANGRVHFFGVVEDPQTFQRAVVEIYESASGWASKIIHADLKESTDLTYPGAASLNQMGNHLNAATSPDGTVMSLVWLDSDVEGNTFPDIWMSQRHISGSWSTPVNLTATPSFAELLLHCAPTLRSNGSNNYTAFIGRSYEAGLTTWPPISENKTIFYAGSQSFTAAPLTKNIQVHSVTVTPDSTTIGTNVTVSAVIENYGSEGDPASVTLTYKENAIPASTADGTTQTFTGGTLTWVNHSAVVTFTAQYTTAISGPVKMYVRAFYAGDEDPANDTQFGPHRVVSINDIAAISLDDPVNTGTKRENNAFAPKASFQNVGVAAQGAFNVRYEILNSVPTVIYSDVQSITSLASGAIQQVTFASIGAGLAAGTYSMRAISQLGGDQYTPNDTTRGTFTVLPVISSFPYAEDFEGPEPNGPLTGGFGWHTGFVPRVAQQPSGVEPPDIVNTIDWVRGTPAKTQISAAHGGTKCYVTRLTGNYTDQTETYLGSPVFDFSSVSGNMVVEFWQNMKTEPNWDGGSVEISTDGGLTWARLDSALGLPPDYTTANSTNWYSWNDTLGYMDYIKFSHNKDSVTAVDPVNRDPGYPADTAGWFKSTSLLTNVAGLSDVRFRFHFSSDDAVNNEGWAIDDFSVSVSTGVTIGVPVAINWNIVSLPVSSPTPDDSVKHLYVNSVNPYAFAFQGGYVQRFVMTPAPGYWVKSSTTYVQSITGTPLSSLTVPVASGWNMIGSISTAIDTSVAHVTPSVSGLRASNYFRYSNGYLVATMIEPGGGYWVKANSAGSFFMHVTGPAGKPSGRDVTAGRSIEDLNTLTIQDANGGLQTLYFGADGNGEIPVAMFAMPPAPPVGSFDARFTSAEGGLMVQTHADEVNAVVDFPITVQSSAYPLTVSWKINGTASTYELSDGAVSHAVRGEGSIRITNSEANSLVLKVTGSSVLPKEFALSQNYPNPFNPTTSIKFALPVESRVTVEIYNVIGQRVRTLVSREQSAGYHVVEWDGTNNLGTQLSSGMYFLRLAAEGNNGKSFTDVRKLMMLK